MPEELVKENTLVILGDEDIVLGFRALGFKVYVLSQLQEFRRVLDEIMQSEAGICLVQEDIYKAQEDKFNTYKKLPLPIFIPFSKTIQTDLLDNIIKDVRIRATGAF